jgi:hypothetical protein
MFSRGGCVLRRNGRMLILVLRGVKQKRSTRSVHTRDKIADVTAAARSDRVNEHVARSYAVRAQPCSLSLAVLDRRRSGGQSHDPTVVTRARRAAGRRGG